MNLSEFPPGRRVGLCGCCWHLPGDLVKLGGKMLLQVRGRQGNSMRLGHELPLQHPGMGLSQNTGWGREWEMGNGPWGFWILCAAIIAACGAVGVHPPTSKRGFSSHFFQVWGAESSWDFPQLQGSVGQAMPWNNPGGARVDPSEC